MAYDKYNNLTKRTESDKILRDRAFKIANSKIQWKSSLIKNLRVVVLNLCQISNFQMKVINQLLENFKNIFLI